jgi:hypothetical protein
MGEEKIVMAVSYSCRWCGHTNLPGSKICAICQHALDAGIHHAMNCLVCGEINGAGTESCLTCGYDLVKVEQIPPNQRTFLCPYCQTANPPPVRTDAAA